MSYTAEYWDKKSPINGRDAAFLSAHFIKQNGNDDRVLVYRGGSLAFLQSAQKTPEEWIAYLEEVDANQPNQQGDQEQNAVTAALFGDDGATVEQAGALLQVFRAHTMVYTDEEAIALPPALYREWTGTGMGAIAAGEIVRYSDTLYRCPSGVTAPLDHQKPGGAGMLAVYAPIRPGTEGQVLPWVYGEALEIGAKRIDPTDGKTYEAIQKPGANIYEPHIVPAIWRLAS